MIYALIDATSNVYYIYYTTTVYELVVFILYREHITESFHT